MSQKKTVIQSYLVYHNVLEIWNDIFIDALFQI